MGNCGRVTISTNNTMCYRHSLTHAYDAAANLVDTDLNGQARGRARFNRVTVFEDRRYTYDAHGRLATKHSGRHTRQDFTWNREHQLVRSSVRRDGVEEEHARYQYDALGRRIAKHDTFGLTTFVWDGMRLLQEKRARRTVTFIYQPDSHEPVARLDTDESARNAPEPTEARIYYFHNHINGAPEELTDANGRIVWQGRYATWGNLALQTHTPGFEPTRHGEHLTQPLRLQGQYADAESGLHYNTFRYYDPDIGRFISEDPIGLAGGINLYEFAPNVNSWVDPWGWCRRGNAQTKGHMDRVRDRFDADNPGVGHVRGGRRASDGAELPETYLPPLSGNGRRGGSYTDMTFRDAQGRTVYVQTVDRGRVNGMSQREWDNAVRITQQNSSAVVITVPKGSIPAQGALDISGMTPGTVTRR